MLNTMNIIEIMRLTDAVYECDILDHGQNIDSFREISNPNRIKRFVRFENRTPHGKYQSALKEQLENIGNGDAIITMNITEQNGNFILSDKGFKKVIFVDLSKVSDEEKAFLSELVRNTMQKMESRRLQTELSATQSKADKLNAGIAQIQDAANKTKAGLGSRNVNTLKQVIAEAAENTK